MKAADRSIMLFDAGLTPEQIRVELGITMEHILRALRGAGRLRVSKRCGGSTRGLNLADPNRADKLLRRFSWQDAA